MSRSGSQSYHGFNLSLKTSDVPANPPTVPLIIPRIEEQSSKFVVDSYRWRISLPSGYLLCKCTQKRRGLIIKLSVLFPKTHKDSSLVMPALHSWLFAADYYDSISVEIVFSLPDKSSYFSENLGSVVEFHHTYKFHFVRNICNNTYNPKI